jgi:Arrestin (or S-antigen), N-terminal domain
MARDLQILLDPPPRGFYTSADAVSGKVVLESSSAETIAAIYIFFRGLVNIEFQPREPDEPSEPPMYKYEDREILFQRNQKLFDGEEKLLPKTRYSWPFTFTFGVWRFAPRPLPPSGKFGRSSVEYKIIAVPRYSGQTEEEIVGMMNPEDPALPRKTTIYSLSRTFANLTKKKLRGVVEEKLQFVRLKSQTVDTSMQPSSRAFDLASSRLPQLGRTPAGSSKATRQSRDEEPAIIPFSFEIQYPRAVAEGVPFPVLLSVTSPSKLWQMNPPPVTLSLLRAGLHGNSEQRSAGETHSDSKMYFCVEKRPRILLTSNPVDVGAMYSFRLSGDGIVPSFGTGLLTRSYTILMNFEFDVGGESFKFMHYGSVAVE